jgi:hypothetical protein
MNFYITDDLQLKMGDHQDIDWSSVVRQSIKYYLKIKNGQLRVRCSECRWLEDILKLKKKGMSMLHCHHPSRTGMNFKLIGRIGTTSLNICKDFEFKVWRQSIG